MKTRTQRLIFLSVIYFFCFHLNTFGVNGGKINFNNDWKFHPGDVPDAQQVGLNDSSWKKITLPHDWSIHEKFSSQWASGTGYLPGGVGWYRKTFTYAPATSPEKVYVYFDGVYKNSKVWINGHFLGWRPDGFVSFEYELTPFLKPGKENVIAVRVDHSDFADSRWYTGSGINRNVYLISKDPLHIEQWGVKFTTTEIASQNAGVKVSVSVINERDSDTDVNLNIKLLNHKGKVAAGGVKSIRLNGGAEANEDFSLDVTDPQLWSVENPYLYRLEVQVVEKQKITDQYEVPVGIRSIRFDADKGFFLNGQNMKLKGVCVHDDAGVLGTAVPREVWARRLKILKEGGCNAIRMSHNPHADYLYGLCDEMGFLVMDEAFDEWALGKNKWIQGRNVGKPGKDGYNKYFQEWAERDVKDMVRRDQNHPSIMMWSIGNEIDYPNDPYTHPVLDQGNNPQIFGRGYDPSQPGIKEIVPLAANLVKWVHEVDTSRPVTAALAGVAMSNFTRYPELLDVVGYNYQEYLYEEDHKKYPERVIYGSENGMSLDAWKAVQDNDYICGQFLWTGIDYLGEAGRWPDNHSRSGLLDLAGNPKPEYYFRKSLWTDTPMIYIGTSDVPDREDHNIWAHKVAEPAWNRKEGDIVRVNCFTNCEAAELFLNGKSLGRKPGHNSKTAGIYWDVPFEAGTLVAKGYNGGKEVTDWSLVTTGKPVSVEAVVYDNNKDDNKGGLCQLLIRVVDDHGNIVPEAGNIIHVSVEGDGALLGLENGNENGDVDYSSGERAVNKGKLLAYIRTFPSDGKIIVHLTSPGLKSKAVLLTSQK